MLTENEWAKALSYIQAKLAKTNMPPKLGRLTYFEILTLLAIKFFSDKDIQALQAKNPKRKNYAWHRLAYTAIIPILILAILSGLCMYKPVQFAWVSGLFVNWQNLRVAHFLTVPIVLIFMIVHIFLSFKVGGLKMIRSMFV